MIKRGKPTKNGQVKLTFTVPTERAPGGISLVGDFNDWDPYAHPMQQKNDSYQVTVTVPADRDVCFRYLAHGGVWFDDEDADRHDHHGGHLNAATTPAAPAETTGAPPGERTARRPPRCPPAGSRRRSPWSRPFPPRRPCSPRRNPEGTPQSGENAVTPPIPPPAHSHSAPSAYELFAGHGDDPTKRTGRRCVSSVSWGDAMSRPKIGRAAAAALVTSAALTGCMPWDSDDEDKVVSAAAKAKAAAAQKAAALKAKRDRAAKAKANELGQIPVLMYHRVIEKPSNTDDRTPKQFRTELERLAKEGYVPITAAEYVTGNIGIPEGRHPVVITFDDASPSQLTLDGTGAPAPDTAVAILQEVAKRHPGFRPVATFFVTRDMFGKSTPEEQTQMLTWLHDNGFDIGNHTYAHVNLLGRSKKEVNAEIVRGHRLITKLISSAPVTLALPYGNQPSTKTWGLKGRSGDVSYNYGESSSPDTPPRPRRSSRTSTRSASPDPGDGQEGRLRQVLLHRLARLAEAEPRRALHLRRRRQDGRLPEVQGALHGQAFHRPRRGLLTFPG
nr:hypothetical protein GCM10020093_071400 [Planobispora longispora]